MYDNPLQELIEVESRLCGQSHSVCGGTFDLLHPGHIDFLKKAHSLGDVVVVGVSNDKRVRERKGPTPPILNQKERLIITDSIKWVDYSLITPSAVKDGKYPTVRIIEALKPNIFLTRDTRWKKYSEKIKQTNTKLQFDSLAKKHSTSRIIKRIQSELPLGQ